MRVKKCECVCVCVSVRAFGREREGQIEYKTEETVG